MSGDTGRTHQGPPALGLVPSGPEEIMPVVRRGWREKILEVCAHSSRGTLAWCCQAMLGGSTWLPRITVMPASLIGLDKNKFPLFLVLPVTPTAELLAKPGFEQPLRSCENFGTGGNSAVRLQQCGRAASVLRGALAWMGAVGGEEVQRLLAGCGPLITLQQGWLLGSMQPPGVCCYCSAGSLVLVLSWGLGIVQCGAELALSSVTRFSHKLSAGFSWIDNLLNSLNCKLQTKFCPG